MLFLLTFLYGCAIITYWNISVLFGGSMFERWYMSRNTVTLLGCVAWVALALTLFAIFAKPQLKQAAGNQVIEQPAETQDINDSTK